MPSILVWDSPTRAFHWLLAVGFVAAAVIGLTQDDDAALFPYHAIIGLTLGMMVALRVMWGIFGTRYARFGTFAFGPGSVVAYFKAMLRGTGARHLGHNPGSAWAIFVMLGLLIAIVVTGVMMGMGNRGLKEIHELCTYGMLGVVAVHILGVVLHTVRHRENLTASMVHGRKLGDHTDAIRSAQPLAAVVLLAATGAWCAGLVRSYEPTTRTTRVPIVGVSLQVGESEGESKSDRRGQERRHEDDD